MTDRIPGAPGQFKAVVTEAELLKMQAGEEFTITMTRDDQPIVEGTPYSKAAVLPDELAAQLCPEEVDPTPADALAALLPKSGGTMTGDVNMGSNSISNAKVVSAFQANVEYLNLAKFKAFKTGSETAYLSLPRGGKMAFFVFAHTQSGACAYVASCEQNATSGTAYKLCGDDYASLHFDFTDPENLVLGVNAYSVGYIMSIDNWQAPYI